MNTSDFLNELKNGFKDGTNTNSFECKYEKTATTKDYEDANKRDALIAQMAASHMPGSVPFKPQHKRIDPTPASIVLTFDHFNEFSTKNYTFDQIELVDEKPTFKYTYYFKSTDNTDATNYVILEAFNGVLTLGSEKNGFITALGPITDFQINNSSGGASKKVKARNASKTKPKPKPKAPPKSKSKTLK